MSGYTNFTAVDITNETLGYAVDGTKVVGAQGTSPAFVNSDLANTVTRINALITALETHGLIA